MRWAALPVDLAGDPRRGVIVVGYFTEQERAFANEAARLMLLVGFGTALLAAGAAYLVAGRILRPLADVAATARTITGTDVSRRVPQRDGPTDEIAALAGTLNAMLDRVQSGMQSQRRFVDDAGHELRTPITIVRGHLDVVDTNDPADVRETRTRPASDTLSFHGLELDLRTRHVSLHGRTVELSAREYALAEVLLRHPGQVLSRDQLLRLAWSDTGAASNVVDVYVRYLRRKLGAEVDRHRPRRRLPPGTRRVIEHLGGFRPYGAGFLRTR